MIDLWPSRRELAVDISLPGDLVSVDRVHKWARAGTIPPRFHRRLIDAAELRGFAGITAELIVALHDQRSAPGEAA